MENNSDKKTFNIVRNRMFSALNSFYIWKKIEQSMNIHEEGGSELAQENVDQIINKYRSFFHQIRICSYKTFIVDLAIFFDSEGYEETLSLGKVIKLLENKGVDLIKLRKEIDVIKKPHGKLIALIMKLRNQDVAHQALEPEQHILNYEEIENLFKAVQDIFNIITKFYDDSVTAWDHIEDEVRSDIDWIYDNLKRGEKVRLEEIHKNLIK
jgi:RNAse (barnase) inhibitor barstar